MSYPNEVDEAEDGLDMERCALCKLWSFPKEMDEQGKCPNCVQDALVGLCPRCEFKPCRCCAGGDARDPNYEPEHSWLKIGEADGTEFFRCSRCGLECET